LASEFFGIVETLKRLQKAASSPQCIHSSTDIDKRRALIERRTKVVQKARSHAQETRSACTLTHGRTSTSAHAGIRVEAISSHQLLCRTSDFDKLAAEGL
jgi:hypothetical protein